MFEVSIWNFKWSKGKECLRSQIVTSEETELEVTNCDLKLKGESIRKENGYE